MDSLLTFSVVGLIVFAVGVSIFALLRKDVGTPKKEHEVFNYKDWMVSDKPGVKKNGR